MGKKQHQSDKLYLTTTEWAQFYGGHKDKKKTATDFKRLPFDCCSLALTQFEHPYCTEDGIIFDITWGRNGNIVPFLKKFGVSPVTGKKMLAKDLIKLNFHKNLLDQYHCPITFKVFNENTFIVAVKQTGNVYAYDTVEKLNIKTSFWKDLIDDTPFTKQDIITIQNPLELEKFNISNFYFMRKEVKLAEEIRKTSRDNLNDKTMSLETKETLDELDRDYKPPDWEMTTHPTKKEPKADVVNAASYSTGKVAAGLTSTLMQPITELEPAVLDEDEVKYRRIKKKAYVRLVTNKGNINLELHSDHCYRASENFIKHCQSGYYNGTIFHRSIRNFMIQGGDPKGTGLGGESIWKSPFKDEFKQFLTHTGRGVLSMANSGPDTNKSQFFITYRSCRHLDGKHTVFGRVVGGLDVLTLMESVEVDDNDKPKTTIKLIEAQVFVDPFGEVEEQMAKEREAALATSQPAITPVVSRAKEQPKQKQFGKGVGKYINFNKLKRDHETTTPMLPGEPTEKKKKTKAKTKLSDFSRW